LIEQVERRDAVGTRFVMDKEKPGITPVHAGVRPWALELATDQ
jgi:hypothetical protein